MGALELGAGELHERRHHEEEEHENEEDWRTAEEGSCRRRRKRGRGRRRVCIARIPDGSQSGGRTGRTESIGTGRERGRVASGTSETDCFQNG